MACGCVPLVSRLPSITDKTVEEGHNGVCIDVGNSEAYVQAMAQVYEDRARHTAMARAARWTVEHRFSVERMAQDYRDVVQRAQHDHFGTLPRRARPPRLAPALITWGGSSALAGTPKTQGVEVMAETVPL